MSRRRSKGSDKMLSFVCTGRGSHSKRVMGKAVYSSHSGAIAELEFKGGTSGRRYLIVSPKDGIESSNELQCPRCGRNLRLTGQHTNELLRKLADSGGLDFDISMV